MPISPNETKYEYPEDIKEILIRLIDDQLYRNNSIFEVPQNLDNDEVIEEIIKIYSSLGWIIKWYKAKRIITPRYKNAKIYTRTLIFEKSVPSKRPNSRLTGRH